MGISREKKMKEVTIKVPEVKEIGFMHRKIAAGIAGIIAQGLAIVAAKLVEVANELKYPKKEEKKEN